MSSPRRLGWVVLLFLTACSVRHPIQDLQAFYYVSRGALDSDLLHLRADGTFSWYVKTHFTLDERLKGTWRKGKSGDFELEGAWRRHVVQGPIDIGGFGEKSGPTLAELRKEISDFLKSQSGSTFAADAIQQLGARDMDGYTLVPISVRQETITRKDLEGVIEAIDAYPRLGREDLIHVTPITSESKSFLHWRDGGPGWVEESLEEMREAVRQGNSLPSFKSVYLQVNREEFDKALREGYLK